MMLITSRCTKLRRESQVANAICVTCRGVGTRREQSKHLTSYTELSLCLYYLKIAYVRRYKTNALDSNALGPTPLPVANTMSDNQEFKIEEVFESAVKLVQNLPPDGPFKPSDSLKLKLYALYKQATCGPNTTSKPRFYQIVEQYKWDAWMKLGDMPREEAMNKYINELKQVMDTIPEDQTDPEENKQFEEILGKKFYDYWFNEWELMSAKQNCDGYKTPTQTSLVTDGQMGNQFELAVLRLQHGLDQTEQRLKKLEEQMTSVHSCGRDRNRQLLPRPMNTIWFHLCYPILVYAIIRAIERRRSSNK